MDVGKDYLRQTNAEGVSVYSHLTEVLATLLATKPDSPYDMLEGVSLACKAKHYSPATTVIPGVPAELPDAPDATSAAAAAWYAASAEMLAPKKDEEEVFEGECKDLLAESALFECAGVGLSKTETYRVYSSLLALQQSKKLSYVRFFGKVLGASADYYVAEATYSESPEPEEGVEPVAGVEESGSGCNTYVYFVSNDSCSAWTVLPDVTPAQIVASKPIRKILTGDLSAPVRAYPPFPGTEKEYLRTMIARISAATTLAPVDKYVMPEEAEPGALPAENEAEEYVPKTTADLGVPAGWCTRYYGLLEIGRMTNLPEEEAGEEEETTKPKPQEHILPLSPISSDEWATATYTHGGPAVAIARSLCWPGSYAAYQSVGKVQTIAHVYVGYGHDTLPAPFAMQAPPPFEAEPDELTEQDDVPLDAENQVVIDAAQAALAEAAAAAAGEE